MITVESQIKHCGCRSVGECDHNLLAEVKALDKMVNAFAKAMKAKLRDKYMRDGYTGWDDRANSKIIQEKLVEHCQRPGQFVDIANLAAMLWNMEQP